jgi:hypothetical protein
MAGQIFHIKSLNFMRQLCSTSDANFSLSLEKTAHIFNSDKWQHKLRKSLQFFYCIFCENLILIKVHFYSLRYFRDWISRIVCQRLYNSDLIYMLYVFWSESSLKRSIKGVQFVNSNIKNPFRSQNLLKFESQNSLNLIKNEIFGKFWFNLILILYFINKLLFINSWPSLCLLWSQYQWLNFYSRHMRLIWQVSVRSLETETAE